MAEFAILAAFTGVCVHDALSVYNGPDYARATHAFCGAHIAGELVAAGQADPTTPGRRRRWMRSRSSTPPPTGRGRRI